MLAAKRGPRPLIRAILFIVRLRRDVQAQHRRRTTRRRMGGLAQTAGMLRQGQLGQQGAMGSNQQQRDWDRPRLKRCESSRVPKSAIPARLGRELHRQQQHRNSAPSTVFLRSPTPQPLGGSAHSLDRTEPTIANSGSIDFDSFLRMPQPYQLKLDRQHQISVQCSSAHQMAARALFQRRPPGGSLDEQSAGTVSRTGSTAGEFALKFFHRQGSVESAGSGRSWPKGGPSDADGAAGGAPRRKLKAGMVGLVGALSALEQGDTEALGAVLARNRGGEHFRLDEPLDFSGQSVYALFPQKLRLLDVALMLGRPQAVDMLIEHGARDGAEVPSAERRRAEVQAVLARCEQRAKELREKGGKEEEKRLRQLDSQLGTLRRMFAQLGPSPSSCPPPAPCSVVVDCVSASAALLQFELFSASCSPSPCLFASAAPSRPVVVRLRVQWSRSPDFSSVEGQLEVDEVRSGRILVEELPLGGEFAFRLQAASIWGWSPPARAQPPMLRISSWTELEDEEQCPGAVGTNGTADKEKGKPDPKELAALVEAVERHRASAVWQRVFPSCSAAERERKRRSGLRHLFSASSKFVRNVQRGLFLASVFCTGERVLCTVDDCLPVICADECAPGLAADDLHWLMKLSLCWEQLPHLQESLASGSAQAGSANSQLRSRLLDAALAMHNALGVKDIGRVHHVPLIPQPGTVLIVTVRLVPEREANSGEAQGLAMRWMRMEKLLRRKQGCPALEFLSRELLPLLNFFESSLIPLEPGLYLGYLRLHSSLNSIHVLVPENLTSALPFAHIRANAHVTREEWAHLRALAEPDEPNGGGGDEESAAKQHQQCMAQPSAEQSKFHEQLTRAAKTLVHDLELDSDQLVGTRLFRYRLVKLNEHVSLLLVMPRAEEVCQVNAGRRGSGDPANLFRGCISVPVPVFQMINLSAYQPDFVSAYCSLSIFLDHFLTVTQFEQRQCLLENDSRVYAEQLAKLADFQQQLDSIWRSSRWISGFASVARDRGCAYQKCAFPLTRLLRSHGADDGSPGSNSIGPAGDWRPGGRDRLCPGLLLPNGGRSPRPSPLSSLSCPSPSTGSSCSPQHHQQSHSLASSPNPSARTCSAIALPNADSAATSPGSSLPGTPPPQQRRHTATANGERERHNGNGTATTTTTVLMDAGCSPFSSTVLRVFAAYKTGLPQKGVSVRLRVTRETSAAEVVQLVLVAAVPCPPLDCAQFCLVSVVGVRERRLRDEFPVLRLQPPWDKGKLCVRNVHAVAEAIELANEALV